jgi:hypothetical protein
MAFTDRIWEQLYDSVSSSAPFHHFPYANLEHRTATHFFDIPHLGSFGVIPLDLGFWLSSFTLLCGQALINMAVASFTYHFLLPSSTTCKHQFLLGCSLVLPTLLAAPIWLYSQWQAPNITLMLCLLGAVPNILTLRVMEAMHGMLPDFCKDDGKTISQRMLVLYYSSTLQLIFDQGQPVPFTWPQFWKKLGHFLSVFLQTSLLFSLLLPAHYQVFPARPIQSVADLWFWGNLANTFCMASLTSLVLDGTYMDPARMVWEQGGGTLLGLGA